MFAWAVVLVVILLLFGPILFNLLNAGRQQENDDPAWVASEQSRHEAIDAVNRRRRETRRAA